MGCTTIHCTTESLWGRVETCAPVVYRRNWRIANPPQVSNLPHKRHLAPQAKRNLNRMVIRLEMICLFHEQ